MAFQWMRRAVMALASASLLGLAACGSGTIESQLEPTTIIAFGDAFSDINTQKYTVNDTSTNNWTQVVAVGFGGNLASVAAGGTSYAVGNARISQHPDAAGNASTPTVTEQISTFLASHAFGEKDLVLINGGFSDIIYETMAANAGTITSDQALANVRQAGRDLGTQVRRLVQSGAKHVIVMGVYDLAKTPWGANFQTALVAQASARFNEELLISIADLGYNVLYIDNAFLTNLLAGFPGSYGFVDVGTPVCTSVDAGPNIGIGAGQVNSRLCTTSTLLTGATTSYNTYLWADKVYMTPNGQSQLGANAFSRIRSRF